MKNFRFTFIILLLIVFNYSVKSQNFKLYYNLQLIKDTITRSTESRDMILWIEKQNFIFGSKNFIEDMTENSVLLDEDIEFATIKNNDILSKLYYIDQNLYKVKEKYENLSWKITDQKKNIDNIDCQLATLQYKGRNWQAWFSTKYPVTFGPYLFGGLPGAIVELKDESNTYFFKLIKISPGIKSIDTVLTFKSYRYKPIIISYKQLEKIYLDFYSNPFRRMKDKNILFMIDEKTGEKQPPPNFDKMTSSSQKYIRDTNNPIELSQAVKYPN